MSTIAEDRSKWNRRYLDSDPGSLLPEPHPMGAQWSHRFAGGPMLDAATGLGRGIATASDAFDPIIAVDISDVGVRRARQIWQDDARIRWIVADVNSLCWPPDFFGLVCAFGFTHLPFFARLPALIVRGGMLLYEGFSRRQLAVKPGLNEDWTATPEQMKTCFAGWEILTCEESQAEPYRTRFAAIRPSL